MDDRHRVVIVFARAPVAGEVKTRLAADIGAAAATAAYVALAERVVGALRKGTSYSLIVAYTPADGERALRSWLGPGLDLRRQVDGHLGARMAAAIDAAFAGRAERVVVVGTDCPTVTPHVVEDAFARLDSADVVIGPASDGGYYLIGMSRLHRALFEDVPWSSTDTLRITLDRARELRLAVAMLDERRDIDTVDDWRAWLADSGQPPPPA